MSPNHPEEWVEIEQVIDDLWISHDFSQEGIIALFSEMKSAFLVRYANPQDPLGQLSNILHALCDTIR